MIINLARTYFPLTSEEPSAAKRLSRVPRQADRPQSSSQEASDRGDLYAYSLGLQAYVYGFPWIFLSQLRWACTTKAGAAFLENVVGNAPEGFPVPMNSFWRSENLMSPSSNSPGTPNVDTLYSLAWCDLGEEPLVLSVPAVEDRYYCVEMSGIDSDTFAYVGTRATGTDPGNYLVAGPGWNGEVPQIPGKPLLDVLPRACYPSIMLLARTGLDGYSKAELDAGRAVQRQYRLTPLSQWEDPSIRVRPPKAQTPIGFDYDNPAGSWLTMNRAMTDNPPGVHPSIQQDQLLQLFSRLGIGPDQDLRTQPPEVLAALNRAARDGVGVLREATASLGMQVNGWIYPPLDMGRAGQAGDYLTRAALQALDGITAHWTIEATYIYTGVDCDGDDLSGGQRYRITFGKNEFPPIETSQHGFWSITLYNSANELVSGSEHYTINSWAARYAARSADGALEILLQSDDPGRLDKGTYWLQSPGGDADDSRFYMALRVYVPGPTVATTQTWPPPAVVKQ